jgi:hypothetical protein
MDHARRFVDMARFEPILEIFMSQLCVTPTSGPHVARRARGLAPLACLASIALGGCASKTLFQSNFDPTLVGQPPAQAQAVGTAHADGPAGSVVVIDAPVAPSGKWVQITRANAQAGVAGLQGNFSEFRGAGSYTFSTDLYIPAGSGLATVQFEAFGQPVGQPLGFLHLDFTQDNRVRIDDIESTSFGSFQRDQPFILQVTLNINASAPTAHVVLAGAGASGVADYAIQPALRLLAQQFGAVRLWMGFPWTGHFDATTIVVTRQSD